MSIARELAQRVCALRYEDIPPAAIEQAGICILDTIGITLAGSREDTALIAARALGSGSGPSLVFGDKRRVSALDAAVLNGTAAHALDFDDSNNRAGTHPSAPIMAALFAIADEIGCSGRDFITAFAAGHEVSARLGMAVNFHHYIKGWQPAATMGAFGAAAACARVLGLNAEQTAVAIACAASLASGIKANIGTMMKPQHIGHNARNGLYAALLAREGYTANTASIFEAKQGFFNVYNGAGNYDAAKVLQDWGSPLELASGISIKKYPCCGSTHAAIDALLALVRQHDVKAEQVARLDGWIHARRLIHTDRPQPATSVDAKFSLQYCLARALTDGGITIEHFEGDAYGNPAIRRLLQRTHVAPYSEEQFGDNSDGAAVRLTLDDGRVLDMKIDDRTPITRESLEWKFMNCAARACSKAGAAKVMALVDALPQLGDVRQLTAEIAAAVD